MAKGQKRSNRENKKPKQTKKPAGVATTGAAEPVRATFAPRAPGKRAT